MAIVYSTTLTNTRLTDVINAIDAGPGNGKLKIGTAAMATVLSTIVLAKPCATVNNRVLTFSGVPLVDASAATNGTAAAARIEDSTGSIVVSGLTVGTVGTDIIINQVSITTGDVVTMLSGTITG